MTKLPLRPLVATAGSLVGAVAVASPASAHVGLGVGGFGTGLAHPILGVDHLLAMVAVGVVAALATGAVRWQVPASFVAGMALGGAAGLAGLPLPGAEALILGSVLVLGLVVAGAVRGGSRWTLPLLALAGIAHGHAHGAEAPSASHPAVYAAGFLLATVALHLTGAGAGAVIRHRRLVRLGVGTATVTAGALLAI